MWHKSSDEELPKELVQELRQLEIVVRDFCVGIGLIFAHSSRDPNFRLRQIYSYLAEDFMQSATAIALIAREGLQNSAKRELRFVLECAVKICFVENDKSVNTIEEKIVAHESEFDSSKISRKRDIVLNLLPEDQREAFSEDVGRLYRRTSSYVHLSAHQVKERIARIDAGRTMGKESADDVKELRELAEKVFAVALVYLFHGISSTDVGDILVENDGSSLNWHFKRSKYISLVDAYFDYKHERQDKLDKLKAARSESESF